MSLFLAPIHTWLFKKIILLESIEKEIVSTFANIRGDLAEKSQQEWGPYLPDQPLEVLIDTNNIHGWLQNRIKIGESRQAYLVNQLAKSTPEWVVIIENIYYQAGERSMASLNKKFELPLDIYQALNDFLLEGMPCDHVNVVLEHSDNQVIWKTSHCVHKDFWENQGVPVKFYYQFRDAFMSGFVKNANQGFIHRSDGGIEQMHRIEKSESLLS